MAVRSAQWGDARSAVKFEYLLRASSVSPAAASLGGGATLRIGGAGLSAEVRVTLRPSGLGCALLPGATESQLRCVLQPFLSVPAASGALSALQRVELRHDATKTLGAVLVDAGTLNRSRALKASVGGAVWAAMARTLRSLNPINECASSPCSHGHCHDGGGGNGFVCACFDGWGGGTCSASSGSGRCDRPVLRARRQAWLKYNASKSKAASNASAVPFAPPACADVGASCRNLGGGGGFACAAAFGFSGSGLAEPVAATVDVDECASAPCLNGGACYDSRNWTAEVRESADRPLARLPACPFAGVVHCYVPLVTPVALLNL